MMVVVPVVDGGAVAVLGGRGPESREQEASGLAWGVGAGAGEGLVELRGGYLPFVGATGMAPVLPLAAMRAPEMQPPRG